jgi:YVTN family beta-propeller protein
MARRIHLMIVCAAICASPVLPTANGQAAGFAHGLSSVWLDPWFSPIGSRTPLAFRSNHAAAGSAATTGTIGTLPRVLVGNAPQAAAFDPASRTVYVANQNDGTLSVVDARRCNGLDTSGCGQSPPTVSAGNGPFAIAIDDRTHTIYVADSGGDTVSVINAATCSARVTSGCGQTPHTVTVGQSPFGLSVDPSTNTIYVANIGIGGSGNTVSVIDGATCEASNTSGCGQTPATVTVGHAPWNVAFDPVNETVYVTDAIDNTVSMIDARTCHAGDTGGCANLPPTANVGNLPIPVGIDRSTDTVYVGNNSDATVSVINGATCNARTTSGCGGAPVVLSAPGGPIGLADDNSAEQLFVSYGVPFGGTPLDNALFAGKVSVIDTATCNAKVISGCTQRAPTAIVGAGPGTAAVDERTDTAYVPTFDNALTVLNADLCSTETTTGCGQSAPATASGSDPFAIAIDRATHTVYVGNGGGADGGPNTVSVINATTCNPAVSSGCNPNPPSVSMGFAPFGVALNGATDTVYATNSLDSNGNLTGDTVSVIDGATCNATVTAGCGNPPATATVGSGPAGVAVNQATDTIYVANANDNTVSVIDGKTCRAGNIAGCGDTPARVSLSSSPQTVAVNEATNTIYVLSPGNPGTVFVMNGATCNATLTSGCANAPATITVGNTNGAGLSGIAANPVTNTIYAANTGDDTISVIDGATCDAQDTSGCDDSPAHVNVGRMWSGFVAVDPTTDLVYVSNGRDDTVSVIDGSTCNGTHTKGCDQAPASVAVGGNPAGLVVNQTNHTVYVADSAAGPVSFFQFEKPAAPTNVSATSARGRVQLAWHAPADGGLPIIYRVTPTPACPTCTGLSTPPTSGQPDTTIAGLSTDTTYTFTIAGIDAAGTGPASPPSNPVTP